MSKPVKICIVGSGYVGLVASVCFAEMGHTVICVDNDEAKVKLLSGAACQFMRITCLNSCASTSIRAYIL